MSKRNNNQDYLSRREQMELELDRTAAKNGGRLTPEQEAEIYERHFGAKPPQWTDR